MAEPKKYLDLTGLNLLWGKIKDNFVLKEDGKGLSSNDYTADEKSKLNNIEAGAQVNVIESVAVKPGDDATVGTILPMQGKTAILTMETDLTKVTADANPLHAASAMAVKDYVDGKISDVSNQITQKNVSAEGDDYISATATDNKVTVTAKSSLTEAVGKANSAVQTVSGSDYINVATSDTTRTISAKTQSVSGASASAKGLAEASDVKTYVDDSVDGAVGDLIGTASDMWADQQTLYGIVNYTDEKITEVKNLVTAATQFLGVSDVAITDGNTNSSITVGGETVTAGAGDIAMYGTSEFIWDGGKWVLLGDTTAEAAAIEDLNRDLGALTTRVSTAESDIDNLEADVAAINKTIEDNEKATSEAIVDLNSKIDAFVPISDDEINSLV